MSKKSKKTAPASTILAIKRPTPPTTDQQPVADDAPSPPPLPKEESSEAADHTPQSHVTEPKPKFPPLITLPEATNASGEVFQPGDRIFVTAPWGERELAEITLIYQGAEGAWAEYKPVDPVKSGWQWERGVCPAVFWEGTKRESGD